MRDGRGGGLLISMRRNIPRDVLSILYHCQTGKFIQTFNQNITELKVSKYLVRFSLLGLIEQEKVQTSQNTFLASVS